MKKIILSLVVLYSVNSNFAYDKCIEQLCIGDEVMDNFGWSGVIANVNIKQQIINVQMPIDGSIHPFPYKDLGKRVECYKGVCEREQVIYRGYEIAEVISIYSNSMARLWSVDDDSTFISKLSELTK